jgi:heme-degrading monooxygenase HmoA
MRSAFVLVLVAIVGALAMNHFSDRLAAEEKSEKVLRHIVLYKFKDGISKEQVQEVIDAFSGLPKKIDGIVGFEHGENVSPEGKSEGLTYAFVVSFRDEAARDAYLKHPAHDAYVQVVKDKREKVVVFDYWTDASKGK